MLSNLGEAALRTALLAGVVQLGLWLLRVRQARALLTAWTVVLAASIAMPMLLRFNPVRFPVDPAFSMPLLDGAADLLQGASLRTLPAYAFVEVRTEPSVGPWLEAAYAVGAIAIALRLVVGVALSLRLLVRSVPFRPDWAAGTRVRISRDIKGPVTIGLVILLPTDVVDWPTKTREAVLAHERAHVARWDFPMLILSQLNRAVFWFSPVSWWLHRRLVALTELASDDQAMAVTCDRLGYAEILLEMGQRPEPAARGLAMARPSTLHYRIDRILLDEAIPSYFSWPRQAVLVAGATSLSLLAANLAPGLIVEPVMTLLPQGIPHNVGAVQPVFPATDVTEPASPGILTQTDNPPATSSPTIAAGDVEPGPFPATRPLLAARLEAVARRPQAVTRLPPRPAAQGPTRNNSSSPPLALPTKQALKAASPQQSWEEGPSSRASSIAEFPRRVDEPDGAPPVSGLVNNGRLPLEPSTTALRPAIEQVMHRTCIGTVAVGLRAQRTSPQQPDVVAGQIVPAQAIFFRKGDGTSWVRFSVFERPPLDLPVGTSQGGLTWIGEYGISYGVQVLGKDRLAGLATLIAHDSAKLELACRR